MFQSTDITAHIALARKVGPKAAKEKGPQFLDKDITLWRVPERSFMVWTAAILPWE